MFLHVFLSHISLTRSLRISNERSRLLERQYANLHFQPKPMPKDKTNSCCYNKVLFKKKISLYAICIVILGFFAIQLKRSVTVAGDIHSCRFE